MHVDQSVTPLPIDLARAGVRDIAAGLRAGDFTSVQLTAAYLQRIAEISDGGPRLNSVRAINDAALSDAAERDRERASCLTDLGPLHGVPILLKDNIDVAGMPTTGGSLALEHSRPRADSPVASALRRAGAVLLGKTNLTEFANYMTTGMANGYSSLGGQVLNPYDASLTTSGSSAGSGSAAATALAAATVGTETFGSILSPALANSLVGVKPTVGLVSRTGIIPISGTQDTAGPMTRWVYDAAALLTAMTGIDPEDPATAANPLLGTDFVAALSPTALSGARLGFVADAGDEVYTRSLALLQSRGATLVPVTVPEPLTPRFLSFELRRDLNAYLARIHSTPAVGAATDGQARTLAEIIDFNERHADVALKYGQKLLIESQEIDLDDPGTAAHYAQVRASSVNESRTIVDTLLRENGIEAIVSNSTTVHLGARACYPSVVVPAGYLSAGRKPAGLLFLGTAWSEATLLALAYDFEQAAGTWRAPEEMNPSLFRRR
ncbi:MAG: Amidase [Microbacteriaceae bacterium]|nr:Amidase [Microbacteriaceae bacterium]